MGHPNRFRLLCEPDLGQDLHADSHWYGRRHRIDDVHGDADKLHHFRGFAGQSDDGSGATEFRRDGNGRRDEQRDMEREWRNLQREHVDIAKGCRELHDYSRECGRTNGDGHDHSNRLLADGRGKNNRHLQFKANRQAVRRALGGLCQSENHDASGAEAPI
jgi:hypothetical protein